MIKKWKVTPISSRAKPAQVIRPESRSKDDAATPNRTSETIHIRTRKPRRHTTGDTKQSVENIRLAKQLVENMNGQAGQTDQTDQAADPNTTLGRKQLISMLKQRYGSEMDSFRTSADHSEKERIRKERQRERDLRHNQRMSQDNREMINHGGVHHSPAMNGSRDHFSGTGSEGSDDSSHLGPSSQRRYITHTKTSKHRIVRRSDSEDEGSHNGSVERLKEVVTSSNIVDNCENMNQSKGVVFLQYTDDVKRVNLPATVSSLDTVKALFVTAFPDRVTMLDFEEAAKVVYIKDMESSTYYMLEDVCEVSNRSFLKIHEKEPSIQSGSQTHLANHTPPEINKPQTLQNTSIEFNQSFEDFKLVGARETKENSLPVVTPITIVNKPVHTESSISVGHTQSSIHPTQTKDTPSRVEDTTDSSNQSTPALRNQMFTKTRTESTSSSTTQSKYDTKSRVHQPAAASHVTLTTNVRTQPIKRRMDSYTSNSSKTESVEDQLDDLTELLKCALDEEERHHAEMIECVNTKNPGKIDPAIIENIQRENETLARKNTFPKHFQPMAMVMAQQESDRKRGEGPPVSPKPKMPHGSHSTYVKTTHYVTNKVTNSTDINNNNDNIKNDKLKINEEAKEGFITPPHKHYYDHNNVDSTDRVDGVTTAETHTTPPKVKVKTESIKRSEIQNKPDIESRKISDYDEAAMSEISDNLIDQIMDLELEVQARASNKSSSIRNRDRSSTGSSSSKSSVTTCSSEKNFSTNQDSSYQQVPIVVHVEQNDGDIKDKSVTDNTISFKHIHKSTSITEENKTANDSIVKEDEHTSKDSVFTNGPSSMQHIYASIQKVTELPTSSSVTTTFGNQIKSMSSREDTSGSNIRHKSSVTTPDFIELEDSARSVTCDLNRLRKELADMRKYHVDSTRSFKADIQKKLLEFRKKAARVDDVLQQRLDVNNNIIFANEHPVRERRHRLTGDQVSYNKKMGDTEFRLKSLEGDMERIRVSVVNKKRVDDPHKLKDLHDELTHLTKGLAEIKNRFHGLHDMLKVVMPDELKIVTSDERFLKEEPQKLEGLIGRCKVLSGTLFTLERLASVQIDAGDGHYQSQTKTQMSEYNSYGTSKGASTSAASYNYHQSAQIENGFEDLKGKRSVRFSNKNP